MLKEAAPDNAVLQIKSLEAFAKAADGQATKIIIPSDIQGIAGLSKSIVEIAKKTDNTDTSVMHWTKLLHENGAVFVILGKSLFCRRKMVYYRLLMREHIPQMSDGCGKNRSVNEIKGSI